MTHETKQTPTPRTFLYRDSISTVEIVKHPLREFEGVLYFARTLERELTESRALCDELAKALEKAKQMIESEYCSHAAPHGSDNCYSAFIYDALSKYMEGSK